MASHGMETLCGIAISACTSDKLLSSPQLVVCAGRSLASFHPCAGRQKAAPCKCIGEKAAKGSIM
eukprot:1161480-Pelagomonas_calceolata.AAC.12